MIYVIIAVSAGLFFYSSFKCWQHYRHRMVQPYPVRRR